ncbi:MAG: hypothetical protein ACFE0I_23835 [Elainellaceae cyanobacterium]
MLQGLRCTDYKAQRISCFPLLPRLFLGLLPQQMLRHCWRHLAIATHVKAIDDQREFGGDFLYSILIASPDSDDD